MRRRFASAAVLLVGSLALGPTASGLTVARAYRIERASDKKSKQQAPSAFTSAPRTCEPDLGGLPGGQLAPDLLGAAFDPAEFDEISATRAGRMLAFASTLSELGIPGTTKQIVLLPEGFGERSTRIEKVGSGDNDQPTVQFDDFGLRVVFRATAAAQGAGASTIELHTVTHATPDDTAETIHVTTADAAVGTDVRSFDPTFTARIRVQEFAGDIKKRQRDAFVAFVSTGDFTQRDNPDGLEQLFLWEEQGTRFTQLTHHTDPAAHVSRPSMDKSGSVVVFESTADLDPAGVDPLDSTRVGNPNHVRQIFRWRLGRGVEQLTWGDADSFSPRIDATGRFLLFSSRADFFDGANADGNSEIFSWTASANPHLRQVTQTVGGNSVLPRPTVSRRAFVFYSTVHAPAPGGTPVGEFGKVPGSDEDAPPECTPAAMVFENGRVSKVHGFTDLANGERLTAGKNAVLTGPPTVSNTALNVFFSTNDFILKPPPKEGDDPDERTDTSLLAFFIARATRYRP